MRLRYAYYGDDFTGSTDVLEQLAEGGVEAVLFVRVPDEALLQKFPDVEAIGIAGDSRSRSPEWMSKNLPSAYTALAHADIVHYKTCSTFDSSPQTGSIGRAMEIGLEQFPAPAAVIVGAPYMGRYVAFGNLFARAGNAVFRIDRHPTMSCHPVTPMHEADLVRHLGEQTDRRVRLIAFPDIHAGRTEPAFDAAAGNADAILFDGMHIDDLEQAGKVLLSRGVRFAVGSSGVTRALVIAWQKADKTSKPVLSAPVSEVDRLLVVSGSCSPVTAQQIAKAKVAGFDTVAVNVSSLLAGESSEEERLTDAALGILASGKSCVIHSAEGPLQDNAMPAGELLGCALGRVAKTVIRQSQLRRVLFAGGDTSSHGVAQLGIDALTWVAPIEAGAPLIRTHAEDASVNNLEMVLKGGQVGGADFFEAVRRGAQPGTPGNSH